MQEMDLDMGSESTSTSSSQSSSTSTQCPSTPSGETQIAPSRAKPHRYNDPLWAALRRRKEPVGPSDFRVMRRVGSGDIGTVYLCCMRGEEEEKTVCAMKVVDKRDVERRKKKPGRADAERSVLRRLDHPFLPTLYAEFDAPPHYSCAVMEYCAAGDLHHLRHRQPSRRFSVTAARFYTAEVLMALEYLHLLGVVYRDLKPENVLLRSDGHIMLSDFDLSFSSSTTPILQHAHNHHPSCLSSTSAITPPRLVAEPSDVRSLSFVGTHEYVAPEVAAGREHGAAVDWWALGVFLYELIYGRTPFVGATSADTLRNVVKRPLKFPGRRGLAGEGRAMDLICRLLMKDSARRLGAEGGAADVKEHRFFRGVKFALIRSQRPPVVPLPSGGVDFEGETKGGFEGF